MIQRSSIGGEDGGGCGLLSVLLGAVVGWVLFVGPHCGCLTLYRFATLFAVQVPVLAPYGRDRGCSRFGGKLRVPIRYSRTVPALVEVRGSHFTLLLPVPVLVTNTRCSGVGFILLSMFRTNWVKRQ